MQSESFFNDGVRDKFSQVGATLPAYFARYLALPHNHRYRDDIDRLLCHVCPNEKQKTYRNKLRDPQSVEHAYGELRAYELLQKLGWSVEIEPPLPRPLKEPQTPDFRIERGRDIYYVEMFHVNMPKALAYERIDMAGLEALCDRLLPTDTYLHVSRGESNDEVLDLQEAEKMLMLVNGPPDDVQSIPVDEPFKIGSYTATVGERPRSLNKSLIVMSRLSDHSPDIALKAIRDKAEKYDAALADAEASLIVAVLPNPHIGYDLDVLCGCIMSLSEGDSPRLPKQTVEVCILDPKSIEARSAWPEVGLSRLMLPA